MLVPRQNLIVGHTAIKTPVVDLPTSEKYLPMTAEKIASYSMLSNGRNLGPYRKMEATIIL